MLLLLPIVPVTLAMVKALFVYFALVARIHVTFSWMAAKEANTVDGHINKTNFTTFYKSNYTGFTCWSTSPSSVKINRVFLLWRLSDWSASEILTILKSQINVLRHWCKLLTPIHKYPIWPLLKGKFIKWIKPFMIYPIKVCVFIVSQNQLSSSLISTICFNCLLYAW